jgi:hypothetical protein
MSTLNPAFSGPVRINGKWGQGVNSTTYNSTAATSYFIDSTAFIATPAYQFGNASRTAVYNLYGPGNYDLDIALVRSFPLHLTETSRFDFRAEMYNVTNHTKFAVASTVFGNATFGQIQRLPVRRCSSQLATSSNGVKLNSGPAAECCRAWLKRNCTTKSCPAGRLFLASMASICGGAAIWELVSLLQPSLRQAY